MPQREQAQAPRPPQRRLAFRALYQASPRGWLGGGSRRSLPLCRLSPAQPPSVPVPGANLSRPLAAAAPFFSRDQPRS